MSEKKTTFKAFYTMQDIHELTGWSIPTIIKIFDRPDFPCLDFGKSKLVKKEAFEEWSSRRHTKNDYEIRSKKIV